LGLFEYGLELDERKANPDPKEQMLELMSSGGIGGVQLRRTGQEAFPLILPERLMRDVVGIERRNEARW
jgi:hypothetical protein